MRAPTRLLLTLALASVAITSACGGGPAIATALRGASLQPAPSVPALPSLPSLPTLPSQPAAPSLPGDPASLVPFPTAAPVATPIVVLPTEPTRPGPGGPIGLFTPWPAPPPTPEPTGYGPLVGRWTHQDEFITEVIVFLPDGRYGDTTTVGEAVVPESGTYSADGSTITFNPIGDEPQTFSMAIDGDLLTLANAEVGSEYTLEPGSPDAVVAEQAAVDQQEAVLDEHWRARLPVAVMGQQPPHVPVGEVPDDPDVVNVFVAPTVFVAPNLYTDISFAEITYTDGTTAQVQNTTNWHFLPTGRVYTVFSSWSPGRLYDRANAQPDVATYWSAYTIEAGGAAERVAIRTDAGEQIDTFLTHGRRNLVWGTDVFGQVDWENEQLQNQDGA